MYLTKANLPLLLQACVEDLLTFAPADLADKQGAAFEPLLVEVMQQALSHLQVSNVQRIELVSGQRFPDIAIHTSDETLGVEVKTSKSKAWSTLGGSIFESTRLKGIDCIYIFFANFSDPQQVLFRYKAIEDCISDVLITHKPRYAIDLDAQESFFVKSKVSYRELQQAAKPFALIRDYMKTKNGHHAETWWVSDEESHDFDVTKLGPQSIKLFSSLCKEEKVAVIDEMYALFPALLSTSASKYEKLSLFLVAKKGLVYSSLRDAFSAGGKYSFNELEIPQYFRRVLDPQCLVRIKQYIETADQDLLDEYWGVPVQGQRVSHWLNMLKFEIEKNDKLPATVKPEIVAYIEQQMLG